MMVHNLIINIIDIAGGVEKAAQLIHGKTGMANLKNAAMGNRYSVHMVESMCSVGNITDKCKSGYNGKKTAVG